MYRLLAGPSQILWPYTDKKTVLSFYLEPGDWTYTLCVKYSRTCGVLSLNRRLQMPVCVPGTLENFIGVHAFDGSLVHTVTLDRQVPVVPTGTADLAHVRLLLPFASPQTQHDG